MTIAAQIPMLLSPKHLSILFISQVKLELATDFSGAMFRYGLTREVADIVLSLSIEEIQLLGDLSASQNIMRLSNPRNLPFWQDLKMTLANKDHNGVNLALVQGLLSEAPAITTLM